VHISCKSCKYSVDIKERLVWVRGHCRINPPRFLAECSKRQLNQGSFVLLYFRLSTLFDLHLVFVCLFSCIVFIFLYCLFSCICI